MWKTSRTSSKGPAFSAWHSFVCLLLLLFTSFVSHYYLQHRTITFSKCSLCNHSPYPRVSSLNLLHLAAISKPQARTSSTILFSLSTRHFCLLRTNQKRLSSTTRLTLRENLPKLRYIFQGYNLCSIFNQRQLSSLSLFQDWFDRSNRISLSTPALSLSAPWHVA